MGDNLLKQKSLICDTFAWLAFGQKTAIANADR